MSALTWGERLRVLRLMALWGLVGTGIRVAVFGLAYLLSRR